MITDDEWGAEREFQDRYVVAPDVAAERERLIREWMEAHPGEEPVQVEHGDGRYELITEAECAQRWGGA